MSKGHNHYTLGLDDERMSGVALEENGTSRLSKLYCCCYYYYYYYHHHCLYYYLNHYH